MEQQLDKNEQEVQLLAGALNRLSRVVSVLLVLVVVLVLALAYFMPAHKMQKEISGPKADENGLFTQAARAEYAEKMKDTTKYWMAPDTSEWANLQDAARLRYGRELIANTGRYFGPEGTVSKASTNGMNCQNCHLDAGTKVWGNNYAAVSTSYPKYRARSGQTESMTKRVNDCFERSLNGKALDTTGKEMQAIVSYLRWLGKDVKKGVKPAGTGFHKLEYLERAADPVKGAEVYKVNCQVCHQANGQGLKNEGALVYTYPPLWGPHSYNTGAGLYRLSNFAKYVKYNMPQGVDHLHTQLSDEEAWDVAAFVNSQARPDYKRNKDWPNVAEKPIDHPFGPFADGFSEQQHKYGPFKPIAAKREELKKEKHS